MLKWHTFLASGHSKLVEAKAGPNTVEILEVCCDICPKVRGPLVGKFNNVKGNKEGPTVEEAGFWKRGGHLLKNQE